MLIYNINSVLPQPPTE